MDLKVLKSKLQESIRQKEGLVLWHIRKDNSKMALEIAGRVVRQRELLRILGGGQ